MKEPPPLPVFVYGTLRPGEKNYPKYLKGRTLREEPARTAGELFYVEGEGYPYVQPGEGWVQGELVFLKPQEYRRTLAALDELEEYDPENEKGSVYLRRKVPIRLGDGTTVEGWIYYWNEPALKGRKIETGDFKERR